MLNQSDKLDADIRNRAESTVAESRLNGNEYTPRKRTSKHLEELASLLPMEDEITNVVPPFGTSVTFRSWDDLSEAIEKYAEKYNLKFRVRSSVRTELYNSNHEVQMPEEFPFVQRIYRCTHGVTQASRSKGHRNRKSRFCNCDARFTGVLTQFSDGTYEIVVRNENHTHSHHATQTEASSYLTAKTLPLEDQDREGVMTLADARVSSTHITNFLNDRLA